jgi:hypothetical protein
MKQSIYIVNGIEKTNKCVIQKIGEVKNNGKENRGKMINKPIKINNNELMPNIYINAFKNVLGGAYLANTDLVPLLYLTVEYNLKFVAGTLLTITIMFEKDEETKIFTKIADIKDKELEGKYYMIIENDKNTKKILLDNFAGYNECLEEMLALVQEENMKNIIKKMFDRRNLERIKQYGDFNIYEIKEPTISIKKLVEEKLENTENKKDLEDLEVKTE